MNPIITDDHINDIEKLLLPEGASFDDERRTFIKCIGSRDVSACAGSGKTTALVAKLMILDKYFLPLHKGKGICVLTHTNVAIDEVKHRLGVDASILNYPNFFGTIQSFVNRFLATPMYVEQFHRRPSRIDNDWYDIILDRLCEYLLSNENKSHWLAAKNWLKSKREPDTILKKARLHYENNCIDQPQILNQNFQDLIKNRNSTALQNIFEIRYEKIFKERGVLCFDDSYALARVYIEKYSKSLKVSFSKRFEFVFIDEMQDSYQHQIDIFDKVFDKTQIIYQCIGDPNQAIYNSANSEQVWKPQSPLPISNSQRFSNTIATAIQNVRLDKSLSLKGNSSKTISKNGILGELKPYIIVFEDSQIEEVVHKFKELIIEYKLHIPATTNLSPDKIKFKAIGWVGKEADEKSKSTGKVKHYIKHYFEESVYKKESAKTETFNNLADYLLKQGHSDENADIHSTKPYKDALTNAFLSVLRITGKVQDNGKHYTSYSFWKKVHADIAFADSLLLKMNSWCSAIIKGDSITEKVKGYICIELKDFFGYSNSSLALKRFLDEPAKLTGNVSAQKPKNCMEFKEDGVKFKIDIATIHSVKGETHTGTLYLETFKDQYETTKGSGFIRCCLAGNENRPKQLRKQVKETLKMAYVGMSRPSHLLCVAVHRDHLNAKDIGELEKAGWCVLAV